MNKIVLILLVASSVLFASGYKIPEQSTSSVAKSAATIANLNGADASYFNPAAMSVLSEGSALEAGLTYIHLPSVDFSGTTGSYSSEKENFLLPYIHYVSPKVDGFRYGFSLTEPAGLSKRWKSAVPKSYAQEFSLKVIELNPTISYDVNSDFSIGGGLRLIYSDGVVKSMTPTGTGRDMTGDTMEFGYNLALHYHPESDWQVGLTYRSKVDLGIEGDAKLFLTNAMFYNGSANVSLPVPAALALGVAYDITDKTTVEVVVDRTFWSSYDKLDFNYASPQPAFDTPVPKNWDDVNAYRLGVTHKYSDKLTLMGGFAIDENPIPESTVGYELPDSDAYLLSFGFDYKIDDSMNFGFGYLLDYKKSRNVTNTAINGEFTDGGAHLVNISLGYKF